MDMTDILAAFANESLFAASEKFLKHLGVKFSTQTEAPIPFLEFYEEAAKEANATIPKDIRAIFTRVENTYFIGTVTDDTLKGDDAAVDFKTESAKPKYEGMFVFAVEMKPGETLKRSEAAVIVRGINRVVKQQPATVLILEDTMLSVATCERTTYKQTWRPGERLGKVSILKGVNCLSPHRGHIGILESMNVKGCKTFDALYKQWMDVFSTSLLTKQFYREIQNWYFWALKKNQHVAFPNALDDDSDDEKYNAENIIRLITRLIFTWFMKEKGLVNKALFDTDFLSGALRHFNPEGRISDSKDPDSAHSCTYYRAILQNLFFATFNQEIPLRGFVNSTVRDAQHYNIKNYFRNAKLFTETDEQKIIGYFNDSPFVNGGLFECLDNVEQNGRVYSWDGFSNHVHFKDGSLKSALIPDCLFFGGETTTDLSEFFEKDKSAKSVKVRGIINILNDYVFTIEENTPFDEDVALDPELLGKVFENLLGCYNPETQQMARNATGSFYTPREIVNYMVKVTLKSYLKRACPKVVPAEIDALVEGVAELADMPSVKENAKDILTALFKAKILDPACGSGAFPMGIMSAMVEILRTVDPHNLHWHEVVLRESLDEAESIADIGDEQERAELRAQIEYDFKERVDHPDYARKLYVIEHCIFGSDIQPIAVQISRLRFFITLLCEQTKNDDPTKNYGITPLPNLESNFVAANSLLSIDLKDMRELLGQKKIVSLVRQLRGIRHQLFLPKTSDKKKRLQKKDEELRNALAVAAEGLYDENIEQKCVMLAGEIKRIDEQLTSLGESDFKDVVKEVEEIDLLGEKTVTTKKVIGKGNVLLKRKKEAEMALASLKNASRKERLLTDVKRLVAWNPFAFNVAESFLDPDWMFGVKDGFDVVIGNPPYIQLQANHGELARLYENCGFETFARTGDIYCLFYERGKQLLKDNRYLCYITSNKWMRAGYGEATRKFFAEKTDPLLLIDFAGEKIFESATVDTNIILFESDTQNHGATLCCIGTSDCRKDLSDFVKQAATPCAFTSSDSWVILSPIEQSIKRKIESIGVPLREWNIKIYRGILTGYNEAFIIDEAKRTEILSWCNDDAERERTDALIRPILRGRDIKRYGYEWAGLYLIATHNGYDKTPRIDIEDYPAIKRHLDSHWQEISKRSDKGDTPYNLRNCAYMDDFAKPKIVYPDIMRMPQDKTLLTQFPKFHLDTEGFYPEATVFFIVGERVETLCRFFASDIGFYAFTRFYAGPQFDDTGFRYKKEYFTKLPIPQTCALDNLANENAFDDALCKVLSLSQEELSFIRGYKAKLLRDNEN